MSEYYMKVYRELYVRSKKLIPNSAVERTYIEAAKRGNRGAEQLLFYRYVPFLYDMALKIVRKYNATVDEMVNSAYNGFVKAIHAYDPGVGVKFYTYFAFKALNEMRKTTYESLLVSQPETKLKKPLDKQDRDPFAMLSLDDAIPGNGNSSMTYMDMLKADIASDKEAFDNHYARVIELVMGSLNKTERSVLTELYLGTEQSTLRAAGAVIGLSTEGVRNIRNKSLAKLRQELQMEGAA